MGTNLLISASTVTTVVAVAVAVLAVGALVGGALRKFVSMSWFSWQVLLVFLVTRLTRVFGAKMNASAQFSLALLFLLLSGGGVLALTEVLRHLMLRRVKPASAALRILNRLFGALTGVLNLFFSLAVAAGLVLAVLDYCVPDLAALEPVLSMPLWQAVRGSVVDIVLILLLMAALRGGYRVGFSRALLTVIMLALTMGTVLLSLFMTIRVPFLASFGKTVGKMFKGMNSVAAGVLGSGFVFLLLEAIFFSAIAVLGFFLNKVFRAARFTAVTSIIDGSVFALLCFAFVFILLLVLYALVYWMTGAGVPVEGAEGLFSAYGSAVEALFTSSPLSSVLFGSNPLRALFGA